MNLEDLEDAYDRISKKIREKIQTDYISIETFMSTCVDYELKIKDLERKCERLSERNYELFRDINRIKTAIIDACDITECRGCHEDI